MRCQALVATAYETAAALDEVLNTWNTLPIMAHTGAGSRAGLAVGYERNRRLTSIAAIHGARQRVLINIGALRELNQVPLAIAPPLLAVPRALRRQPAKRL